MTDMDWVRAALQNAKLESLTIDDLIRMAEWADSAREWDTAVNELIRTYSG